MTDKSNNLLSPRLQRLHDDIQLHGHKALEAFWADIAQHGTPVIEPSTNGYSLVTFLWRDDNVACQIAVIQDWGADGIREHHMTLLSRSEEHTSELQSRLHLVC